ncbi:hypothetical protein V9T40_010675 [Parthenolecanium corni]|uniref:Uncharacterized protein n=1 Tax=Parthenolecanium corni TaxID=536013 RepID=A0AAN9T5D7_9HEMI
MSFHYKSSRRERIAVAGIVWRRKSSIEGALSDSSLSKLCAKLIAWLSLHDDDDDDVVSNVVFFTLPTPNPQEPPPYPLPSRLSLLGVSRVIGALPSPPSLPAAKGAAALQLEPINLLSRLLTSPSTDSPLHPAAQQPASVSRILVGDAKGEKRWATISLFIASSSFRHLPPTQPPLAHCQPPPPV